MTKARGSTPETDRCASLHSIQTRSVAYLDSYPKENGVLSPGVNRPRYETGAWYPPSARVISGGYPEQLALSIFRV